MKKWGVAQDLSTILERGKDIYTFAVAENVQQVNKVNQLL